MLQSRVRSTLTVLGALTLALASAAHAELADVKKRGELRVVMSGEYPPFSQPGSNNTLQGFDVDIAREIARRLGVKATIIKAESHGAKDMPGACHPGVWDAVTAFTRGGARALPRGGAHR